MQAERCVHIQDRVQGFACCKVHVRSGDHAEAVAPCEIDIASCCLCVDHHGVQGQENIKGLLADAYRCLLLQT